MQRVDQERLRSLVASGITVARISEQTGWSSNQIYNNMRKLGIHTTRAMSRKKGHKKEPVKVYSSDRNEKICPECGKRFYVPNLEEWVYRMHSGKDKRFRCSWSCFRKASAAGQSENEIY